MVQFVHILDPGDVTGVIIIAVAAMFAIFFLSLTLVHMSLVLIAPSYAHRMASPQERNFITSPLGFYIISLLASNYTSAIGGVLELQWIGTNTIAQGPACTMQAILLQLGNNATALWIGILSISALRTFMFRARPWPKLITLPLILFGWVFMIAFDSAASAIFMRSSSGFFYGPAGMWCWITSDYREARMIIQYGWMWFWSIVGAICFLLVLLSVRGNIVVKVEASGSTFKWRARSFSAYTFGGVEQHYGNLVGGVGKTMCWFPVTYIVLTFPLSVIRVSETYGFPVPAYAFTLAAVVVLLLGIVNPALYFAIRHSLKHAAVRIDGTTLRSSYGPDKAGLDSFATPQEKRPSYGNKFAPYQWSPTSTTTNEWAPPSAHHDADKQAYPNSPNAYGTNSGANGTPLSIYGTPAPRPILNASTSVQTKRNLTPRASFSTSPRRLPSVVEVPEPISRQLTLPPAALMIYSSSTASPIISSPSDMERFAHVPLTPGLQMGRQHSNSDASVYSGPRSISPNMNALIAAMENVPVPPTGLPPPPRKPRRSPITNVPVDVDESDEGSVCSAQPTAEAFSQEDTLPMSPGDVATRNPKREDSMSTFWAAYEDPSPITPNMPMPPDAVLRRDTMRSFWAAYEDRSPEVPSFSNSFTLSRNQTMDSSRGASIYSSDYKRVDSSVLLKPSTFNAIGNRTIRQGDLMSPPLLSPYMMSPPPMPPMMSPPFSSPSGTMRSQQHRRSRSLTSITSGAAPFILTPGVSRQASANALPSRLGSPQPTGTSTPTSRSSDYRAPRPQPGYL